MRTPNTSPAHALLIVLAALLLTPPARAQEPAKKPAAPATAPKDVNFEKDIKAYEEADKQNPPAPGGILFTGSSSIRLWKTLKTDFPGMPVINRGFGGSQLHHVTMHADRIVIPYKPRTIVLYSADNDLKAGKTPERVAADLAALVKKIHAALPETKLFILAVKPSPSRASIIEQQRETNRLFKELVAKDPDRLTFVDIFTPMLGPDDQLRPELYVKDNLHMSPAGYELWTSLLKPMLK